MNRPRSSLLSAASLFSVLVSTSTAFIETAREESLVIRPKKQILFANAFEETTAERIPNVPDEVFQREEILEQDHDASKESGQAVYEPAEHAHKKSGKESATSWFMSLVLVLRREDVGDSCTYNCVYLC